MRNRARHRQFILRHEEQNDERCTHADSPQRRRQLDSRLLGEDREVVSVKVTEDPLTDEEKVVEHAKQIMAELAN